MSDPVLKCGHDAAKNYLHIVRAGDSSRCFSCEQIRRARAAGLLAEECVQDCIHLGAQKRSDGFVECLKCKTTWASAALWQIYLENAARMAPVPLHVPAGARIPTYNGKDYVQCAEHFPPVFVPDGYACPACAAIAAKSPPPAYRSVGWVVVDRGGMPVATPKPSSGEAYDAAWRKIVSEYGSSRSFKEWFETSEDDGCNAVEVFVREEAKK